MTRIFWLALIALGLFLGCGDTAKEEVAAAPPKILPAQASTDEIRTLVNDIEVEVTRHRDQINQQRESIQRVLKRLEALEKNQIQISGMSLDPDQTPALDVIDTTDQPIKPVKPIQIKEMPGFRYELVRIETLAGQSKFYCRITSLDADLNMWIRANDTPRTRVISKEGVEVTAKNVQSGPNNSGHGLDIRLVKGIALAFNVTFEGTEDFDEIALLELSVYLRPTRANKTLRFTDFKLEH